MGLTIKPESVFWKKFEHLSNGGGSIDPCPKKLLHKKATDIQSQWLMSKIKGVIVRGDIRDFLNPSLIEYLKKKYPTSNKYKGKENMREIRGEEVIK